jgi:uncharacterized protein YjiS (DUF1127 family)
MSRARTSQTVPRPRAERAPTGTISHLMSLPWVWLKRLRCRHELSALSPEQMRDVGLDPEMVRRESGKPFWEP